MIYKEKMVGEDSREELLLDWMETGNHGRILI